MSLSLDQLVEQAAGHFRARYGRDARWMTAAPGRVNIIGEHVDYNDGFVLPMAIERYCVIAAGEDEAGTGATVFSGAFNEEVAISVDSPQRRPHGHWSNYVAGVLAGCARHGMRPRPFQAVIEMNVPVGGGLSSSAALEMALATLVAAITGMQLAPVEKALVGQWAEHNFAGVPCGIMDQFASSLCRPDHLMLLDCRSQQTEQIPLTDPGITVLIVNTNVKHAHTSGEYAARRSQCESAARKLGVASLRDATKDQLESCRGSLDEIEYRRARHVIGEIERTPAAATAIRAGNWPEVGRLMYASHESLRDDYEVSSRELDLLVNLAREIGPSGGVMGARMTGGGFGGCTVTLVETEKVDAVAENLAASYRKATRIEPALLTSRPARGAHVVRAG
jgi:galactokinase